jgi:hypothetical protein
MNEVVRRADRVHVPGQVKVEVLHRDHLRVAAPRGAALDPEDRAQARLPDRQRCPQSDPGQTLGEADGRRALALAERCRARAGDDHVPAPRLSALEPLDPGLSDLRLGVPVQLDLVVA